MSEIRRAVQYAVAMTAKTTCLAVLTGSVFLLCSCNGRESTSGKERRTVTREWQHNATPEDVLRFAEEGNENFRSGRLVDRDFLHDQRVTAAGQFPLGVVLGCIDSRAPAEIVFDAGIGDMFNVRVAGNVLNPDILGSLEYACKVAGAKLIIVLGHSKCGAVKGAIDGVELGNLTGLLAKLQPAVEATKGVEGERNSENDSFIDAVAVTNVRMTLAAIRAQSPVLAELERSGSVLIVGAMYDVKDGTVTFLE